MAKYSNGMQIGFVMLGRLATRKLTSAARHAFLSLDVLLDGRAKNFWNLQCVCPLFAVVAEAFREKDCERSFCHTFLTSVIMDELEKKSVLWGLLRCGGLLGWRPVPPCFHF